MDEPKQKIELPEPELYEEPPKLRGRDVAGIILALAALTAIALAGYVWLTPGLSFGGLTERFTKDEVSTSSAGVSAETDDGGQDTSPTGQVDEQAGHDMEEMETEASSEPEPEPEMDPAMDHAGMDHSQMDAAELDIPFPDDELVDPHLHDNDFQCAYCGMKSEISHAQVVVEWSVGGHGHFDSWDCAFGHGNAESLRISRARVMANGSTPTAPVWLDAAEAWFLYGTDKKIKMSMPPYVAAYDTRAAAEAAQPEWGGEVVDFAGLQALWE